MSTSPSIQSQNTNPSEKTFSFEKKQFIVDLIKWFIGSVVLVLITLIIDKGFRERSAGIQEMQAYDKYVEVILKADNIEERWKLSEYFATVTPTERLRDRWKAYKELINDDYMRFRELKDAELELQNRKAENLTEMPVSEADKKLKEIQIQLAPYEKKLIRSSDFNAAQSWEEKGFQYLLEKDVANAIDAFRNSEAATAQYHQVYEIARYLNQNKSKLSDRNSPFWDTAYRKIASDYSWGMPAHVKNRMLGSEH